MKIFKNIFLINRLDFVIALYMFCIIAAEVMGAKTFPLLQIGKFNLNASVGIFLIPLIFAINDSVIEVYGVSRAKSIYRSGLLIIFILIIFSAFAISLPPSQRFLKMEPAYDAIFGQSIRISIASLIAFAFSDLMDIVIFARITRAIGKKILWLRTNVSNFISSFIDTTVFMVLAFYAFDKPLGDNIIFLTSLILPYWLLKSGMSIIETPLVYIGVNWLKEAKKGE